MLDFFFYEQLAWPVKQMNAWIGQERAVRIGQSSVVSRKVHTMDPSRPEEIRIMQALDAGQIFYQRRDRNAIFHVDTFHQCGFIDHRQIAKAIKKAMDIYNFHQYVKNGVFAPHGATVVRVDWIDVQTGTGGGRVTGSLEYGKKVSLRKAHQNHVHIAGMIPFEHTASIFYLVQAIERVILDAGLELRANERITHDPGIGNGKSDVSAYSDYSDSYLVDKNSNNESSAVRKQQYLQDTADLMEEFDSAREIKEFLQTVEHEPDKEKLSKYLESRGNNRQALSRVAGLGIITIEKNKIILSQYGREYKDYIEKFLPDVETHIKRLYRLLKPQAESSGKNKQWPVKHYRTQGHRIIAAERDPKSSLAIAETIQAAAKRAGQDRIMAPLQIMASDLHYNKRIPRLKTEICILIDTSASMAGQRINAAKFLIRHLLLSTPDRICVVTFQENIASVQVPFTRDYRQVEEKLKDVKAFGSTPLGLGLTACTRYLEESRPHNPLILLITDGMPTFSENSRDPIMDALTAAQNIKKNKFGFACIGLKPHHDYLHKLADAADGKMYIVEELDRQALVRTVWVELQR